MQDDLMVCYIRNLITDTNISFKLLPDEFLDSNSANFDPQTIRGRSAPYQGYDSSGPRSISYTIQLHNDYCESGILDTVDKLRALTYPMYGGIIVPPQCFVRFGSMIAMKAIVGSVGVTWKKPFKNGIYLSADVSLELTEVTSEGISADVVERGGDRL